MMCNMWIPFSYARTRIKLIIQNISKVITPPTHILVVKSIFIYMILLIMKAIDLLAYYSAQLVVKS